VFGTIPKIHDICCLSFFYFYNLKFLIMTETKTSSDVIPWGPVGYVTYKRTYSRPTKNGRTEEWQDTIERVVESCRDQLEVGFTQQEENDLREIMTKLKGTVAGRFLWQLGTKTVDRLGLPSLQNCAFVVCDEPIRPFTWAFEMLMLGSGVGFNIQREHVYQIPKVLKKVKVERIDVNDADFIVPDSREGWVELMRRVLEASFVTGKGFTYACHLIRSKGSPIKGFGGVASGPQDLVWGIGEINSILNARAGKRLRSIDCLDIMNIIGRIVVAGNVRRSAQIALGDYDDFDYLRAKRWDLGGIPNWRAMSNNSVVCDDISKLPEEFWEGYNGNGEPYGLINLDAARRMGRTGETQYPDPEVMGFNPCAEQSLANYETCCLAEIYLPNIESKDELWKVARTLYRINKHSLAIKCEIKETEDIVHKNMRMGIGVTGYLQATDEQRDWLSGCYTYLREYDIHYSEKNGFSPSIKLTTVKPSGTLSLLAGVTSGAHPGYSEYYIRRIRMASDSPIVDVCRKHNFPIEFQRNFDGTEDHSTVVVSFPCKFPKHTLLAKDMSAVDQLYVIQKLQAEWSDNAVSVTIYYRKHELDEIKQWLSENYINVKSVSFLLHNEHGFDQAPLEEITEDKYNELSANVTPISSFDSTINIDDIDIADCEGGACPVR
jgi:ribonucleotide reductase alpha subunit